MREKIIGRHVCRTVIGAAEVAAATDVGSTAVAGSLCHAAATAAAAQHRPPPRPAEKAVWIPGHWRWVFRRHVWIPGHWGYPPPGRVWVPGHWVRHGPGWYWDPGYWR